MGKDLNRQRTGEAFDILEELAGILHDHDQTVVLAAEHGCMEADEDADPPCVDVPLGLLRRARSALLAGRASRARIRTLEAALKDIARLGKYCPSDDEETERTLRQNIPALARTALSARTSIPEGQADQHTRQRTEELEWALREILRHEDEGFQYPHELTHRVRVDIPQLAEDAIRGFEAEDPPFCYELPEDGVPS